MNIAYLRRECYTIGELKDMTDRVIKIMSKTTILRLRKREFSKRELQYSRVELISDVAILSAVE